MPSVTLADPFVVEDPSIMIDGQEYKCAARAASLIPEQKRINVETFCNPGGERPAAKVAWTFDVTLLLSYGAAGTRTLLSAIQGQKKTVVLKPADAAVAVGNPSATFEIYIPPVPFMVGTIGEAQEFQMTVMTVGAPVVATS